MLSVLQNCFLYMKCWKPWRTWTVLKELLTASILAALLIMIFNPSFTTGVFQSIMEARICDSNTQVRLKSWELSANFIHLDLLGEGFWQLDGPTNINCFQQPSDWTWCTTRSTLTISSLVTSSEIARWRKDAAMPWSCGEMRLTEWTSTNINATKHNSAYSSVSQHTGWCWPHKSVRG